MSTAERAGSDANMSCCAVGCKNRFDKDNKTRRFYRIPSERTPFKANKRRLWLQAIRRSDWSQQMIKNAKICSDHFISGAASDDFDSPDFVPSIFSHSAHKDGDAKLERYERTRRRADTRSRLSALSPYDGELEAGNTVRKAEHEDLKLKYRQLQIYCDTLRVDVNNLRAENEQLKAALRSTQFSFVFHRSCFHRSDQGPQV